MEVIMINKIKNSMLKVLSLAFVLAVMISCEKDSTPLDLDKPVKITEFKIGDRQGIIDNENARVLVTLPAGTLDITALTPQVSVSEGAKVEPASGTTVDFTDSVAYRVYNGNVYQNYWVRVEVLKAAITGFTINGTEGLIDDVAHTIDVPLPLDTDLTNLVPHIEVTPESTVVPASGVAQDFTNPVTYTVTGGSQTVDYLVSVSVAATPDTTKGAIGSKLAFLGTATDRFTLPDDDEQAAADWLFSEYPDAEYISWIQIMAGGVNIYSYKTIWWHYDANDQLPAYAAHQAVIDIFSDYMKDGGNLFLSGHAVQYFWNTGRLTKSYPMAIGNGEGFENPDTWTIGVNLPGVDHRGHPIYQNLTFIEDAGFFTFPVIGPGWKEDHNHVIVEIAATEGYPNNAPGAYVSFTESNQVEWLGVWGGIRDYFMAGVMELLPNDDFNGRGIYLGIGGFEFNQNARGDINPTGDNPHQDNIHTVARNTIDYLMAN
jgi:hypothetical protein